MSKKNELAKLIKEENKEITRADYFKFLTHSLEDYSSLSFTEEEMSIVQKQLQRLSTGSSSTTPMLCTGPACFAASYCELQKMGRAPIGRSCLIEVQLLNYWIMQYMNEYQVDPENFTEVSMCNELAEIEMLINRLNWALSRPENAELVIDQAIGADRNGDPVIQKQLSPYMVQKEKLQKRRTQLIKLMVGDRQEKYKKEAALKQREELDPSSKQAEMRRKLDELARSMERLTPSKDSNVLTPDAIIASLDD